MKSVKRAHAIFMITVFFLLVFLPIVLPSGTVSAQNAGYTINQVDHSIEVMDSGQVVVRDTIHVSGQVTDGFMIGLPASYSADVLEVLAFDSTNVYQVNLGVQLGNQNGFYGASVNFNGNSPSVFTVAFILSNSLITDQTGSNYTLNFPAYPSLTQEVGSANVTITLPSTPTAITITKADGTVSSANYVTQNLPAYTYSIGSAAFQVQGTLDLTTIDQLNRQITLDPTGKVSVSDNYHMIDNATSPMGYFILGVPNTATNLVVKDGFAQNITNNHNHKWECFTS